MLFSPSAAVEAASQVEFKKMEDIQPMVAEAPAVAQYPPTDHGGFTTANVDVVTYGIGNPGDGNSVAVVTSSSAYVDSYSINQNSVAEAGSAAMYSSAVDGTPTSGSVATHEYAAIGSENAAGYVSTGSGINETGISASTGAMENANPLHESGSATHQPEIVSGMSSEEDRLWALVRANSLDFNAWTALIEETEKGNNIINIRKVYDSFLAEFPLCFGYWKKYADLEGRLDTIDKVWEVYERAVLAVTYSVDIWVHYCQFAISTHSDPENIRRLFERGLAYVGTDYLSYTLWDEYISYEYGLQEWRNVAMIYTRILENPLQQLDRYYNSFKEYASSRPLSDLQSAEEAATASASVKASEEGVEGEVRPSVELGLTEEEELAKYMETREEMYKKAKEFDSKIIAFESAIRRPYFHVRPLDDPELENWHNYLDFIQGGDDFNKVVKLYERCLIACANYPEYWIRYVLCMESSGSMELANNALARATRVFVKKQPEIHLFAARFKEHSGDILGAQAEYQYLRSEFPTVLLEAIVKHANMEMRVGNRDASFAIYEEAITAEQGKESSEILPFIYVQYSRFSFLVVGDAEKAREILTIALEKVQLSKRLLEAVIHLESFLPLPKRIDYLDSFVEKFTTPSTEDSNKASTSDREDISCIFLEFLDLFGEPRSIKKAEDRHSSLFRHRSISVSRKRRSDHLQSEMTKMSRTQTSDQSATQSAMGGYPNAQNVWPVSYGQNPPVWPQVPHGQGQQWNPGYTPQPGYSGYGGYGTYTQPQLTSSVQQNTSYGAYPTTSPVQAYTQPNYTQPATSYAQQPASTAQTYYHGYY